MKAPPIVAALAVLAGLSGAILCGCSVGLAAGAKTYDPAVVHPGATRAQIEAALGRPESEHPSGPGVLAVYRAALDAHSSTSALENGFMDVITLGLAEAVQYPEEKNFSRGREVRVIYDPHAVATGVEVIDPPPSSATSPSPR